MGGHKLALSYDQPIQAFPLRKGYVNLVAGTFTTALRSEGGDEVSMAHCVSAGDITITWNDGTTDTISCFDGDDFSVIGAISIEVVAASGTFHLA